MEPGQGGVSGMLDGDQMFIKPEGFDELHNARRRNIVCARILPNGSRWESVRKREKRLESRDSSK
jgi:lysine 2,3-aminomutase